MRPEYLPLLSIFSIALARTPILINSWTEEESGARDLNGQDLYFWFEFQPLSSLSETVCKVNLQPWMRIN